MPAMGKVESAEAVFSFGVEPQVRCRSDDLLSGARGADTTSEVPHLHHVQTSRGVFGFGIAPLVDPDNRVLRLLESAMHVSSQVSYLQDVPRSHVQKPELRKSFKGG